MPYEIPTLPALITRTEADFERNAPDALRRSDAKVAARALSGAVFQLFGYQSWVAKQAHPATCDEEQLLRWADWRLEDGRKPAVPATGVATVTGSSGFLVDAGTVYQAGDGRRYVVKVGATLVDGAAQLQLVAETAGPSGNIEGGQLTAVKPVLGVNPTATIGADGIVGGTDQEEIEALRARVRAAFKNPSKVGNAADFVEWALEVPGVTRAWALPRWMGPGTFGLTFVCDGDADIFPSAAKVAEVQAYLERKRPVTSEVYVFAAQRLAVDLRIKLTPDTTAVRQAVGKALAGLISDEGGSDSVIPLSHIRAAISNAPGETDHRLDAPTEDVVVAANQVAVLGGITWL
ncbi:MULTISPECIES: baseplate J/gp47 family protein [Pseudomonas]|uniref:baseplate J/gp47 family protein n=1 Tax=Pseudomonas guariconensis TaxID=1288410 RepID=UPI002097595B|nr:MULTISPECIES: baseplate J/gp47 family protein [Pseudomonas]MCO7594279.1 baseplate J/gp47 family protein [Pseudomonas guariconensis]MCU7219994.1 baseplate J/gp47 family protein [Pseudomonas brassicacearum]